MTAAADSPVERRDRPRRAPRRAGHAVPRSAHARRRPRAPGGRARGPARRARRRTIPASVPMRCRCSSRAAPCAGARHRAVAVRSRSRGSWKRLRERVLERRKRLVARATERCGRARSTTATRSSSRPNCSTRCCVARTACAARLVEVEAYRGADDPGQPLVPRPDAAQRDDVRTARHALRVLLLRHPLVHERGVRSGTTAARGAAARGRAARGARRDAGTAGQGAARSSICARAREPRSGVRLRSLVRRHRPHQRAGPHRRRRHPAARGPGVSVRVGLGAGKGDALPYRFFVPGDPHVSRTTTGSARAIQSATSSIAAGRCPSR